MRSMAAVQDSDDEEDDFDEIPNVGPPRSRTVAGEEEQQREHRRRMMDTRRDRCLNDPEQALNIFFSGYYRDRGMSG